MGLQLTIKTIQLWTLKSTFDPQQVSALAFVMCHLNFSCGNPARLLLGENTVHGYIKCLITSYVVYRSTAGYLSVFNT